MAEEKKGLVNTPAKFKKEKPLEKLLGTFLATDSTNIKEYLVNDIFIPLVKRGISGTVDMLLYGKSRSDFSSGFGTSYYSAGKNTSTRYDQLYTPSNKTPINAAPRANNNTGYKNILFETRGDAEIVLRGLQESIEQFGIVSVTDMYDMARVPTDNYALNHYGWTNLDGVGVVRDGGGFAIDLPRPSPIK